MNEANVQIQFQPASSAAPKPRRRRVSRVAVRRAKASLAFLDGHRRLDARTWQYQFLDRETTCLTADLGGELSRQQQILVRLVARQVLLVELIDAWLLEQQPVHRSKRALLPVVRERQGIVDGLTRMLGMIGLERQARPVKRLRDVMAAA